ncbi:hypothetical protein [Capnocytophaga sp.]|uniref:hypothetical protein n=1 Tax=Capnocytophaga sp. TaxID=44737 RepID=UPI0026DD51BC|nr:hypothetical protein [Capnocytophaga sp.]MDO5105078.1 hypothetical protein [Capnocytophaga sp.]
MKTIIALSNNGNTGKTETLRILAQMLIEKYPELQNLDKKQEKIPSEGDFRFVVQINSQKIGIESEGNPDSLLKERLGDLTQLGCNIIFCTSRTRGETVKTIEKIGNDNDFQIIWTSTYQTQNTQQYTSVNRLKAEHLWDLVQQIHSI